MKPDGQKWAQSLVLMQADLAGQARWGGLRINASVGVVDTSASRASVFGPVVSREHWIGYGPEDDSWLIRAGRLNLPYGLRIIEHTMFVRAVTRTDINDTQQHGASFAYSGDSVRGEFMAILGNYQLSPDAYRERGYSGFIEVTPIQRTGVGLSSLVTHAARDVYLQTANTRQVHGPYVRVAPWSELVVMAEADLVVQQPTGLDKMVGYASMLQADVEPLQGLHAVGAVESYKQQAGWAASWALWAGLGWFFAPHADVRLDFMRRSDVQFTERFNTTAILAQGHVFL
jgi:hypothetical protein